MGTRSKVLLGLGATLVVLVAAGGFGLWYFFFRDDSPPPVDLGDAVDSLASASPTVTPTGDASPSATAATGTATSAATPGGSGDGLDRTWTVDTSLDSFVGYRVQEELAGIGGTTAVGRTSGVTGEITIAGGAVTAATIEADLTGLRSDRSQRDGALRNQALETGRFPTATFELAEPVDLPASLAAGEPTALVLRGNLTLHGVTRAIEFPVDAQFTNGVLVAVGSIEIQFADYDIDQPRAASVLSVEDHGVMEVQLYFR